MRASRVLWSLASLALIGGIIDLASATQLTPLVSHATDGRWSRDGSDRILYSTSYNVWTIPATGGSPTEITYDHAGSIDWWPSWSDDGSKVAFWNVSAGLVVAPPVAYGDFGAVLVGGATPRPAGARLSPAGDRFAFAINGYDIYGFGIYVCPATADGYGERTRVSPPSYSGDFGEPCWSADGGQILFPSDRRLHVMPADGSEAPTLIPVNFPPDPSRADQGLYWPDLSADGRWIACVYGYAVGGIALWGLWVVPSAGGNPIELIPPSLTQWTYPSWSPDGTKLVVTSPDGLWIVSDLPAEVVASVPDHGTSSPERSIAVYPNPSPGGPMTIRFHVSRPSYVDLSVVDTGGRLIKRLASEWVEGPGRVVGWDGADANGRRTPPGIYYVRLKSAGSIEAAKIIVAR